MLSDVNAYRRLFEHSMDAVLLTAPDGRIVSANQASLDLFGYTLDELVQAGRAAVVDAADPRLAAALEERRRTGRFRGELTMRRKDGSTFPAELSSAIFRDEDGTEWASVFVRDISQRKAYEATRDSLVRELEAKRRWLEAVLEHVPVSVILFEADGRLTFNRKAEETLGMTLSPVGGSSQYRSRILFRDGSPVPHDRLVSTRVLEHGETITGAEFLIERPDGSRVPILGAAGPVRDDDAHVIGAIGLFQDVSERMRSEEAVRASERLLDAIFELLPVGVWIADNAGRIVRGNKAGIAIWAGARYVGPAQFGEYRAWWADTGRLIRPEEWALARAATKGETSIGEVIRIQCFDGSYKTIINSALPLFDEAGRHVGAIVVNEDITRLKEIETALRDAMQSRDQVLEIVAHDLRHPLQVILTLVHALFLGPARGDHERATLAEIETQVRRMNALIDELLEAQLAAGPLLLRRSRLSPDTLVQDVCQAHLPLLTESSLRLGREMAADLPEISVDPDKMHRVFGNLIANAVKFTPPEGSVTIGAARDNGYVRFWVRDTGPGVAAESVPQMFTPRWQAEPGRGGFGLGLPIAKSIVEAHGGRIWADSRVGQGTTVFFTVPSVAG